MTASFVLTIAHRPPATGPWPHAFVCTTAVVSRTSTTPSPTRRYISSYKDHSVPTRQRSCVSTLFAFLNLHVAACASVLSLASQQFVYSPISRCTRPRLPNAITKFRPGRLASAGRRYLSASLPLRTVPLAWTSPACPGAARSSCRLLRFRVTAPVHQVCCASIPPRCPSPPWLRRPRLRTSRACPPFPASPMACRHLTQHSTMRPATRRKANTFAILVRGRNPTASVSLLLLLSRLP